MKKIISKLGNRAVYILIGISLAIAGGIAYAAGPVTPQTSGGTGTSTIPSTNSLILQGVSSGSGAGFKGLAPGASSTVLTMIGSAPGWAVSSGGSGVLTSEVPVGTYNGSNTVFTVSNTPSFITVGGQTLYNGNGYNLSGLTVTFESAPLASASTSVHSIYATSVSTFTPTPTQTGQIVIASSTSWVVGTLVAGSNITLATSTTGQLTISAAGGSGSPCTTTGNSIQFNSSGSFGCVTPLLWNGTTLSMTGTTTLATTTIANLTVTQAPTFSALGTGIVHSSSGGLLSSSAVVLSGSEVSGVLAPANGGTGTSSVPSVTGQILAADSTGVKYAPTTLLAGTNITLTTSTPGQITIAASGSGVSGGTAGKAAYFTSATALSTGNLIDNGTVVGFNATSSTIGFNIQGTAGTNTIFNVASSTGSSVFSVQSNGDIFITPIVSSATALKLLNSTGQVALQVSSDPTSAGSLSIGTTSTASILFVQASSSQTSLNLFTLASSSGASLFTITPSGYILTGGTTPTTATSTGIGSAAGTVTLTNADSNSGLVTFSTGSSPAANSTIVTITFPVAWGTAPNCQLTKATTSPASAFDIWATTTTTTLLIKSTATAIPASATTAAYYHCMSH